MSDEEKVPPIVYMAFCGFIDQAALARFFHSMTLASVKKVEHIHLLFQSNGGVVSDGVALYNFFQALPLGLTVYNVGNISSIAVIAYLGAKARKTSTFATFMLHRTQSSISSANAERFEGAAKTLRLDDERTQAILKARLKPNGWKLPGADTQEVWFTARQAIDCGLADEIAEFAPPIGSPLYNI